MPAAKPSANPPYTQDGGDQGGKRRRRRGGARSGSSVDPEDKSGSPRPQSGSAVVSPTPKHAVGAPVPEAVEQAVRAVAVTAEPVAQPVKEAVAAPAEKIEAVAKAQPEPVAEPPVSKSAIQPTKTVKPTEPRATKSAVAPETTKPPVEPAEKPEPKPATVAEPKPAAVAEPKPAAPAAAKPTPAELKPAAPAAAPESKPTQCTPTSTDVGSEAGDETNMPGPVETGLQVAARVLPAAVVEQARRACHRGVELVQRETEEATMRARVEQLVGEQRAKLVLGKIAEVSTEAELRAAWARERATQAAKVARQIRHTDKKAWLKHTVTRTRESLSTLEAGDLPLVMSARLQGLYARVRIVGTQRVAWLRGQVAEVAAAVQRIQKEAGDGLVQVVLCGFDRLSQTLELCVTVQRDVVERIPRSLREQRWQEVAAQIQTIPAEVRTRLTAQCNGHLPTATWGSLLATRTAPILRAHVAHFAALDLPEEATVTETLIAVKDAGTDAARRQLARRRAAAQPLVDKATEAVKQRLGEENCTATAEKTRDVLTGVLGADRVARLCAFLPVSL